MRKFTNTNAIMIQMHREGLPGYENSQLNDFSPQTFIPLPIPMYLKTIIYMIRLWKKYYLHNTTYPNWIKKHSRIKRIKTCTYAYVLYVTTYCPSGVREREKERDMYKTHVQFVLENYKFE